MGVGARWNLRIDFVAQGGTEAFFPFAAGQLAGIGFAAGDEGEDAVGAADGLEEEHFLVHPAGLGRGGGEDADEIARGTQRVLDCASEVGRERQLVAVAETWKEFLRHVAVAAGTADEVARNAIGFQRLVEALAQRGVLRRIGDEAPIAQVRGRRFGQRAHRSFPRKSYERESRLAIRDGGIFSLFTKRA